MMAETAPARWLITGTLSLKSALTVRSGHTREIVGKSEDEPALCAMVQTDQGGDPYIPGSSLKGALRAWLTTRLGSMAIGSKAEVSMLEELFGHEPRGFSENPEEKVGRGGKAEFHDAFVAPDCQGQKQQLAHTAIDRKTGTAKHRLLAHTDAVPAGCAFEVTLTADNLTDDEAELLVTGFEGFNVSPAQGDRFAPLTVGGGASMGRGRAQWSLSQIRIMTPQLICEWMRGDPIEPWRTWLERCTEAAQDATAWRERARRQLTELLPDSVVTLPVRLRFEGPFIVNDPARYKGKGHPDMEPRVDERGRALLPGSSIKGVLRSHAERIMRTLGREPPEPEGNRDGKPRHIIEWLFGVGGRRSVLTFGDFHQADKGAPEVQHFVAIDRFTGGAADTAKFEARVFEAPVFCGEIALRLRPADRYGEIFAEPAMGLLALVLRDLVDGDLTLGMGAAKGFGACRAELMSPTIMPGSDHPILTRLLDLRGDRKPPAEALPAVDTVEAAESLYGAIVKHCLKALERERGPADG